MTYSAYSNAPSLLFSEALPVTHRTLRITLPEGTSPESSVTIRAEEGGEALLLKPALQDGKLSVEWTPSASGYYNASVGGMAPVRFPVVARELTFLAWPPLEESESHYRSLSSHVLVRKAADNAKLVEFWKNRGSKVLGVASAGSREIHLSKSREENRDRLLSAWERAMGGGVDGVYIDELGGYPDKEGLEKSEIAIEVTRLLREKFPKALIFPAICGAPLREMSAGLRAQGTTALLEVYNQWLSAGFGTHRFYSYLDRRIEEARHVDAIFEHGKPSRAIIFIGVDGMHGGMSRHELEDYVRYIRRKAPEMLGMAFYASGRTMPWLKKEGVRDWMEEMCERYFVRPVVELQQVSLNADVLQKGKEIHIEVRVGNIGGMTARSVTVALYAVTGGEKPELLGRQTIKEIGCERVTLQNKDLDDNSFEIQEMNGRNVPLFNIPMYVWNDRHTLRFPWSPKREGAYRIQAVIEPNDKNTTLDGYIETGVFITADR